MDTTIRLDHTKKAHLELLDKFTHAFLEKSLVKFNGRNILIISIATESKLEGMESIVTFRYEKERII